MTHEAMSGGEAPAPRPEPATSRLEMQETEVGSVFVSNYPPFSQWSREALGDYRAVLEAPAVAETPPLGLYLHIPFCRKRCDFCYFKVYTDKNAAQIRRYLDALLAELDLYRDAPRIAGRRPDFVYFGGGTPSYLSSDQLRTLFEGLRERVPWDDAREVAFECEPGTLQEGKVRLLRELGVTRLSLGVENFDPDILERNNRAHRAVEIDRAWGYVRSAGFPQVNVDLIAGMIGESDENWSRCIQRTLELEPDSITVYQMEVPYNTTIYQRMSDDATDVAPVADWETKRRWTREAFERFEAAGYAVGSAYTAYRPPAEFVYRDALWHGADMLALGVASFGHLGGVHFQNEHTFDAWIERVEAGERPASRALVLADEERLIRELVLQMKLGRVDPRTFERKFGVDVLARFAEPLRRHAAAGLLEVGPDAIRATREGLLRIDTLLPDFFLERHQNARYA